LWRPLGLVLVLFTDAITIDLVEVRRHRTLALLVVGPGTLLTAALVALVGWWLLALPPAAAIIVGAALASTDPVLLRNLLAQRDLPNAARQALRFESGVNDAVLLPIVLVSMAFLGHNALGTPADWARLAVSLLLLGPGAGVAVGLVAVAALDLIRRRTSVRRDYESLYALGTAFTAYAAAEAVHGSGFLAAFAAGLTIATLDVELCDCFLEYGQTTAELALLFTFVLLGGSLIWSGLGVLGWTAALFAVATVLLRPAAFLPLLALARVERRPRWLIAWFGPRGLSSLLLVLLPVFGGMPGSGDLFALCSLVVLLSLLVHGGTPMVMARTAHRADRREAPPPFPAVLPAPAGSHGMAEVPTVAADQSAPSTQAEDRISIAELRQLSERGEPILILDARTERSYNREALQASGSIRLEPDHVAQRAAELGLQRDAWLVAYCT
jgi:NhaP-type Na+/H+ or K+/H+ antiporter